MALVFGTAGLPHILMRFFTVPTAQQARKSVVWAMVIIGGFYVLTLFLGFRRGALRRTREHRARRRGRQHGGPAAGAVHRRRPGFDVRQFHAGIRLGGGFCDHRRGGGRPGACLRIGDGTRPVRGRRSRAARPSRPQEQVQAARIATVIVGAIAIGIGIAAKGQNAAVLVGLAFAVAASANFPCVLLTLYWKRCNTGGIVAGMLVGTIAAVGLSPGFAQSHLPESSQGGGPQGNGCGSRQARGGHEAASSADEKTAATAKKGTGSDQ